MSKLNRQYDFLPFTIHGSNPRGSSPLPFIIKSIIHHKNPIIKPRDNPNNMNMPIMMNLHL